MNSIRKIALHIWSLSPRTSADICERCSEKIFETCQTQKRKHASIFRAFYYLYLIVAIFRFLFAGYVLLSGEYTELQCYDVLMSIGIKMRLINPIAALCAAPLPIFALSLDYFLTLKLYNYIFNVPYDVMVHNPSRFLALNPQYRPTFDVRHPIETVKSFWQTAHSIWEPQVDRVKFSTDKLQYLPNISIKLRIRLVFGTWFAQLFNTIFLSVTFLVILVGGIYYYLYLVVPNVDSMKIHVIAIVDIGMICIAAFTSIKHLLFMFHCIMLLEWAIRRHVKYLNGLLQSQIYSRSRRYSLGAIYLNRAFDSTGMLVRFYLQELRMILLHAIIANQDIISCVIYTSAVSNFSLNIYLITALNFLILSIGDRVMIWLIMVLQFVFTLLGMRVLLSISGDIYSTGLVMHKTQCKLRDACTKIKLMAYFERIHSHDKFCFSLGSFGRITSSSFMEFMFFYSGYLLFIFGMIQTQMTK